MIPFVNYRIFSLLILPRMHLKPAKSEEKNTKTLEFWLVCSSLFLWFLTSLQHLIWISNIPVLVVMAFPKDSKIGLVCRTLSSKPSTSDPPRPGRTGNFRPLRHQKNGLKTVRIESWWCFFHIKILIFMGV